MTVTTAKPAPYIGGTSNTIELSDQAVIVIESNDGRLEITGPQVGLKIHLITPLSIVGKIEHEGRTIEYRCIAAPRPQVGMTMSRYPKLFDVVMEEKVKQIAAVCVSQQFARMGEDESVFKTQYTEFRTLPYRLVYEFSLTPRIATKTI